MTWLDDLTDEMPDDGFSRGQMDPIAIDALFGRQEDGAIPDDLSELGEIVRIARMPGTQRELAHQRPVSAAVAAIVRTLLPESAGPTGGDDTGRMRMVGKRKRRLAKLMAAGTAGAALLAGGVAAAAGLSPGSHASHQTRVRGLAHMRSLERVGALPSGMGSDVHRGGPSPVLATTKWSNAPYAFGTVTSVDGSNAAGTCGTAGSSGSFTVSNPKTGSVTTVDVTATTKFADPAATGGASFANLCVGDNVGAASTKTSSGTFTAAFVYVQPPKPVVVHRAFAFGTVTSVDGSNAAGTCGTAGSSGSFTVSNAKTGSVTTVDVTATTKFADPAAMGGASFANLCVGDTVGAASAKTASGSGTISATFVYVQPPKPPIVHRPYAFGTVTSVDGSNAAGTCGTAGSSGSFTVSKPKTGLVTTVDVTATTKFADPAATGGASFANVCVGDTAGATGPASSTTSKKAAAAFTATFVYVQPPKAAIVHRPYAFGMVKTVDGSSTPGSCGTAGAAGSFVVAGPWSDSTTVDVTSTTRFVDPSSTSASFADVCVGDTAGATGTPTAGSTAPRSGTISATFVYVGHPFGTMHPISFVHLPGSPQLYRPGAWGQNGRLTFSPQDGAAAGRPSTAQYTKPSSAPQSPQSSQTPPRDAPSGSPAWSTSPQSQPGSQQGGDPGSGGQGQGGGGSQWGSGPGQHNGGPQGGTDQGDGSQGDGSQGGGQRGGGRG